MDGWMDKSTNMRLDEWMDKLIEGSINCIDEQMHKLIDECINE